MDVKKTNLALSADVTKAAELIQVWLLTHAVSDDSFSF
jgi:hypothetical protein